MNKHPMPREAPGNPPSPTDPARPRRAPGAPDQPDAVEAPSAPEPSRSEAAGAVGVDPGEAHVGATEEQVGDRTGPGAGYDQKRRK